MLQRSARVCSATAAALLAVIRAFELPTYSLHAAYSVFNSFKLNIGLSPGARYRRPSKKNAQVGTTRVSLVGKLVVSGYSR